MMNLEVESLIDVLSLFKNVVEIFCVEKCLVLNQVFVILVKIKIIFKIFCKNLLVRKVIVKLYEGLFMRVKFDEEIYLLQ